MKKFFLVTMLVVAFAAMTTPTAQAVPFYPEDCVENGTPWQNTMCAWYMAIAIMHERGFDDLYGMAPDKIEKLQELEAIQPPEVYALVTKKMPVIWYPLRA